MVNVTKPKGLTRPTRGKQRAASPVAAISTEPHVDHGDEVSRYLDNYHRHYVADSVDDIYFRLTRATVFAGRKWRKLANDELRRIGQSQARWETLFMIAFSGGEIPQSQLARMLSIEGPTMVRMLEVLENDGLIERKTDPADGRQTRNRITRAGEAALLQIKDITNALRIDVLRDISLADIAITQRVLSRMIRRLDLIRGSDTYTPMAPE
jgi:MarR family transcriptional regulator, transcriptional regulator for hemolysin